MQLSYEDKIKREYNKAMKRRDKAAALYYSQQFANSACVSWERFKESWAGQEWLKKFQDFI